MLSVSLPLRGAHNTLCREERKQKNTLFLHMLPPPTICHLTGLIVLTSTLLYCRLIDRIWRASSKFTPLPLHSKAINPCQSLWQPMTGHPQLLENTSARWKKLLVISGCITNSIITSFLKAFQFEVLQTRRQLAFSSHLRMDFLNGRFVALP